MTEARVFQHPAIAEAARKISGRSPLKPWERPWPAMDQEAYHGLAGDVVRTIEPHTEADPVAILVQVLTNVGNIIGRCPYYQVESDYHRANLFCVLVGQSSKARKGTSAGRVHAVVGPVDEQWLDSRVKGGLSSGEGLINEVRDEVKKWNGKDGTWEVVDPGVSDKRLMVYEPEFAGALVAADRHGNLLSQIIRKAWDGGKLETLTKGSQLSATSPHISIVGHITAEELRARLTRTDAANGFANRFLFVLVKRSKELPFGGALGDDVIAELNSRFKAAVEIATRVGRVNWSTSGADEWASVYGALSAGQAGLLGAVTSRAEAQVPRIALIYALLDWQTQIGVAHLRAALAVWEYCEASAAFIFGDSLGDEVADDILRALQLAGGAGLTRTAIRDHLGRNRSADRIGAALALLMNKGKATAEIQDSGGRPTEVWFASEGAPHG